MSEPSTLRIRLSAVAMPTVTSQAIRKQAEDEEDRARRQRLVASAQQLEARDTRKLQVGGDTVTLAVGESRVIPVATAPKPKTLQGWRKAGVAVEVERLCTVWLPKDANFPELLVGAATLKRGGKAAQLWLQDHDVAELMARGLECADAPPATPANAPSPPTGDDQPPDETTMDEPTPPKSGAKGKSTAKQPVKSTAEEANP